MSVPAVYQGEVVEPSHVSAPHSYAAHDFFNTIRDLLHQAKFHNEQQLLNALSTVDGYEKHVTGPDARYVVSDGDRAAMEDVGLRIPPTAGLPQLAPAQQIDYARLAAAIVAAQAAAKADTHAQPVPEGGVPSITDAAPGYRGVPAA